jgi:hypothetical protein
MRFDDDAIFFSFFFRSLLRLVALHHGTEKQLELAV